MNATPQHPEFRSVILTIDHLSKRNDGHLAQKMVTSTEDLVETMLSLFDYYKEVELTQSKANIELFQKASQLSLPAFIYRTSVNTQVVLEWNTFAFLTQVSGSMKGAVELALNNAAQAMINSDEARGDVVPLLLMAFDMEAVKDPGAEAAPASKPAPRKRCRK